MRLVMLGGLWSRNRAVTLNASIREGKVSCDAADFDLGDVAGSR
jgi:hypothetical protein